VQLLLVCSLVCKSVLVSKGAVALLQIVPGLSSVIKSLAEDGV